VSRETSAGLSEPSHNHQRLQFFIFYLFINFSMANTDLYITLCRFKLVWLSSVECRSYFVWML